MNSFVVEIGTWSGEGEYRQWDSEGFYAGYEPNGGPMIVKPTPAEAIRFPTMERASYIPGGNERIKNRHRIMATTAAPNV